MATVIGESGAWRELVGYLGRYGLKVSHPNDVGVLLARRRSEFQPAVDAKKQVVAQDIASEKSLIDDLRAETGIWRSIVNWFRIRGHESNIARMHSDQQIYIATLSANIDTLDAVSQSAGLVGARAELEVVEALRRLPDDYTVFSNVVLVADRYIHFDGVALQSAQIDHLVLSPAGVFVVETKQWSQKFVESGNYHNPFDQVRRANYLCYDMLRKKFGKVTVRSIIACGGQLPEAPAGSYTKVLPISRLAGYISWFKDQKLSPRELVKLRSYLESQVA